MIYIIETMLLVAALSADAFVVSMCYGASGTKINPLSAGIISIICTAFLAVSVFAGEMIGQFISVETTRFISCAVMCLLGFWKMLDNSNDVKVKPLSAKETVLFSVSLSIDGLAAGVGTGIAGSDLMLIIIVSLIMTFAAIELGIITGRLLNAKKLDFNIISGVVLVFVGLGKLIY